MNSLIIETNKYYDDAHRHERYKNLDKMRPFITVLMATADNFLALFTCFYHFH